MPRPNVFYIHLANQPPENIYYPGYKVEGFVYLQLNESMRARGLFLQFYAREQTEWTIQVRNDQYGLHPHRVLNHPIRPLPYTHGLPHIGGHRHTHGHHHHHHGPGVTIVTRKMTQSLNYIDLKIPLFGDPYGNSETILPVGNSQFFFSFNLPNYQLPPSIYNLEHGKIIYVLRAYLDLTWRPDFEAYHNIQVRPFPYYPPDFYISPCKLIGDHTFGCCFKSGILNYSHQINKNIFNCGESIYISGVLENNSSVKILGISAHIGMEITYFANGNTKVDHKCLCGVTHPPTAESYAMEMKTSPDITPTTVNFSQLIKVSYNLVITIKTKGCHANIVKSIPIIIVPAGPLAVRTEPIVHAQHVPPMIQAGQQLPLDYTTYHPESAAQVDNLPQYEEIANNNYK